MSPTIEPIAPWYVVLGFGALIIGLTLWAYHQRLRGSSGRWRYVALGLRLLAVLMCLVAVLKPSLLVLRKIKQQAAVVFLLDDSTSMSITDEANNRSRFETAQRALDEGRAALKPHAGKIEVKVHRFDDRLHVDDGKELKAPTGTLTALGSALDETLKQNAGTRLIAVVPLTDGANNTGLAPLQVAQRYKGQQTPIFPVGFGSETAASASRDLIARELIAGPVVFVKNQPAIRAVLGARGFASQRAEVELYVEDSPRPVDTKTIEIKDANGVIPITDFKWIPQRPGETKLTFKVKPKDGELVQTNNQISTYVSVQSGGVAVLYLAGPGTVWEQKYLTRALDAAPEIQVTLRILRRSAAEDPEALPDEELAADRYDVILLGDLPADFLKPLQVRLIRRNVERGGGLMMLGGRSSFGAGGWASTELASLLPTAISATDGQIEPPNGVKVVPVQQALDNYLLRIGPNQAESLRLWTRMPALPGANRLGPPKAAANVLVTTDGGDPLMVAQEVPPGRVLTFAGETWPWFTAGGESQAAHRKFWRQAILWLAHKEDQGAQEVHLALDRRRVSVGQKLELTATARDAKGQPLTEVSYKASIEPLAVSAGQAAHAQDVPMFNPGTEGKGSYIGGNPTGEYRATVIATKNGQEIGRDSARFLVFQDDRELENPAADHALLQQLAVNTGGKVLNPETLASYLKGLKLDDVTETVTQKEVRLWDNWYFLMVFAALLTAEWWLRKRHGWV